MASKGALQKAAMADVRAGKPRQDVFDAYKAQVSPVKHLAFSIASVADPERMKQGAALNKILFGLLVLAAATKALMALAMFGTSFVGGLVMLLLGLFVPIAFAIAVRKFDGQVYPFLMLLAGVGAARALLLMTEQGPWMLVDAAILGAIAVLAFRVQRIVFPNMNWFAVRKDAQGDFVW